MAFKNRYFRNLPGKLFSFIGIGRQTAYSDSASFTAFVTEAVDGEVGIFNATTGVLCPGSVTPTPTTDPIFFAVRRGADILKSKTFTKAGAQMTRSAYVAPVKGAVSIVLSGALTVGTEAVITVMDITPGSHPQLSREFRYKIKTGDTLDLVGAALAALINDTTSEVARSQDQIVTSTYTAGTDTLLITCKDEGTVIKVLQLEAAALWVPTVTKTVLGSGYPAEVRLFEEQELVQEGVTTLYPNAGQTPENWGKPASSVVDGVQYNHYTIAIVSSDTAKTVQKIQNWPDTLELIVPSNGTNPEAAVKYVLGL
jgi:hypothetical protein